MFLEDFLHAEGQRTQGRNAFVLNLCVPCPSAWEFFKTKSFNKNKTSP